MYPEPEVFDSHIRKSSDNDRNQSKDDTIEAVNWLPIELIIERSIMTPVMAQ